MTPEIIISHSHRGKANGPTVQTAQKAVAAAEGSVVQARAQDQAFQNARNAVRPETMGI